jgi:predicted permease
MFETPARETCGALRQLARDPFNTILGVALTAIGIGAAAAAAGLFAGALVSPLPYDRADALVTIAARPDAASAALEPLPGPAFARLDELADLFASIGAVWARFGTLTEGEPEFLQIGYVTPRFFSTLRIPVAAGRHFTAAESVPNGPRVMLLGHRLWLRRFGADASIVGRAIRYNGEPFTVVGVLADVPLFLPTEAAVPASLDAYLPWQADYRTLPVGLTAFSTVARLRDPANAAALAAALDDVSASVRREHAALDRAGWSSTAGSLPASVTRPSRPYVVIVTAAALAIFAASLLNLSTLMALRGLVIRASLAVRVALGATPLQASLSLGTEALLLSLAGGVIGTSLAVALIGFVHRALLVDVPFGESAARGGALACGALATALAGPIAALWPTIRATRAAAAMLGLASRRPGEDAEAVKARSLLVAGQVALAALALVLGGLLSTSLANLSRAPIGFAPPAGAVAVNLSLPAVRYPYEDPPRIAGFYRRLLAGLRDQPGMRVAGITSHLPFSGASGWSDAFAHRDAAGAEIPWGSRTADYRAVSPGLFPALGARLVGGRFFTDDDDLGRPPVAIISRPLAEALWPGQSAVGNQLRVAYFVRDTPIRWATVVGVVEHVRYDDPRVDGRDQIYLPHAQSPQRSVTLVVDSIADPATVERQVRGELKALDAGLAPYRVLPVSHYVSEAARSLRLTAIATVLFSGAAVAVSMLGVYLVLARTTAARSREIGTRIALGAAHSAVVWLVLRDGLRLGAGGMVVGCLAGIGSGRIIRSVLYGVDAAHPPTIAAAVGLLVAAVAAASLWPAYRATRLDPARLVRGE